MIMCLILLQDEGGISEGIIVSRVNEKGPANRSQMHVHDRIIEVSFEIAPKRKNVPPPPSLFQKI